jgi:hypothetical protein
MSPNSIEDPRLRAEYEAAISANQLKAEYYNRQYRLRQNEPLILKDAIRFLSHSYRTLPRKDSELKALLKEKGISLEFQRKVLAALTE